MTNRSISCTKVSIESFQLGALSFPCETVGFIPAFWFYENWEKVLSILIHEDIRTYVCR